MLKRKSQNLNDACIDDESAWQSGSENRKCSKKSAGDVIDNGQDVPDLSKPELSKLKQEESTISTSVAKKVPSDEGRKEVIDRTTLRRSDHVDATPPTILLYRELDEQFQHFDGTPTGITSETTISKSAENYDMTYFKRGTCLVLNHDSFEKDDYREGSNFDVKRIDATFSKLGFDVVVHDNLYYSEVMEKIETLSKPENHVNNDCVCVFVLTHGQENDYVLAKDVAYSSDKIWKPFTADKCPTLAGKPKLFFLQACRGKKLDGGVRIQNCQTRHQTDSITTSYTLPTLSDFLIAHSCADGFLSWRNPHEGTWYVQTLCDVLDQFGESLDLMKMLTITARKVATEYESFNDQIPQLNEQKQVPTVTSTLTRDLYFTPK